MKPCNICKYLCFVVLFFSIKARAGNIVFNQRNAVAWLQQQTIEGKINGIATRTLILHQDKNTYTVPVTIKGTFSYDIILHDSANNIWAEAKQGKTSVVSDTLILTLDYHPTPLIKPVSDIKGDMQRFMPLP